MKILSIIIPYQGEPEHIISPLLNSINNQKNIDFNDIEILINNDTDINFINEFINNFTNICSITTIFNYKLGGPGPSRQYCIDNCSGKYIFCCDCDDHLAGDFVLNDLLSQIYDDLDIYEFGILNEHVDEHHKKFYHIMPTYFDVVYNKLYKVSFLKEHGIKFHPQIKKFDEDRYFNIMISSYFGTKRTINLIGYIYTLNETQQYKTKKICRGDYPKDAFLGIKLAFADIKGRNLLGYMHHNIMVFIYLYFCDYYNYLTQSDNRNEDNLKYMEHDLKQFVLNFDPDMTFVNSEYANGQYHKAFPSLLIDILKKE